MALVMSLLLIGFGTLIGMVLAALFSKSAGRCEQCYRSLDDDGTQQ